MAVVVVVDDNVGVELLEMALKLVGKLSWEACRCMGTT